MTEKIREGFFAQLGRLYSEPPWSFYEVGLALLVLAVTMFWIAPAVAAVLSSDTLNPTPTTLITGWMIGLLIAAGVVLLRWKRSPEHFAALRLIGESGHLRRPYLLLMMIGVATNLTANLIVAAGAEISHVPQNFSTAAILQGIVYQWGIAEIILALILVVIVQPIAEGIIFFGVLQPRMRVALGAWPGLILTAVFYAGFHFLIYGTQPLINSPLWYGFMLPFLLGLVLASVRVWLRSTRAAIIVSIGIGCTSILTMIALG